MNTGDLISFLAKMCYYAQEHINDKDAWSTDRIDRADKLECTSYAVACFLSQHVNDSVDWDVVIQELSEYPAKPIPQWELIITDIIHKLQKHD